MPASLFIEGDQNARGQILIARPFQGAGGDPNWKLCCCYCGFEYEARACDFHDRECPACQRGHRGDVFAARAAEIPGT
jgi:hypothetical protein